MRILKWGIPIVLVTTLLGWFYIARTKNPSLSLSKPPAVSVSVTPFESKKYTPMIEAIGTARAFESVVISVNVTEFVEKVHFKDGQYVKKGAPLITLGKDEEQAQLMRIKAQLGEAKAQFERTKKLIKKNYSARSEYDLREATMKAAAAQLQEINAKINDRIITAPFSGILGFRQVSEGALLEPGDSIVTLDMIKPLKVDFTLAEHLLSKIKIGQTFQVESIAYQDHTFKGTISAVATRLDEQSRSVKVRGIIANKKQQLKPGMLLKIRIPLKAKRAMIIPEQALLSHGDTRYIFAVKNNIAYKIPIEIIQRNQGQLIIRAKIPKKSMLVIDGGFKLKPGMKVDTQDANL